MTIKNNIDDESIHRLVESDDDEEDDKGELLNTRLNMDRSLYIE